MSAPAKRYLGDSVYATWDPIGQIWLTTENGMGASNRICLEPEVLAALEQFAADIRAHVESLRKEPEPTAESLQPIPPEGIPF